MQLLERYQATRQYSESLCSPLHTEDYIPQAVDFTSPPKWHLAHTTWFFETMVLVPFLKGYAVFDSAFGFLFNSYYQGLGERAIRGERGLMTRPTVADIYDYRRYVDKHIQELLSSLQRIRNLTNDDTQQIIESLIVLGINHEEQHQELLITDVKYTFSLNPTFPVYEKTSRFPSAHITSPRNPSDQWVTIHEGMAEMGYDGDSFCFDNELGRHKVYLSAFQISPLLVTNKEYLAFINEGGYQNFSYWLDEGWAWVQANNIVSPLYWHNTNNQWHHYTLQGLQAIPLDDAVCHVSYYEANAFAHWKQCRLPTEFEWEAANEKLAWGTRWEWTASAYQPYPRFSISDGAVGEYNGKFMVNQMVLRGSSEVTSPEHSRASYRNFFHPHHQWQYSGIRLARDI